jgi:hypothetical protein
VSAYPKDWADCDLDAAVAALTAAGAQVLGTREEKKIRHIEFILDGRMCALTERTPRRHGEWVALDFPWPAEWPDVMLTGPGEPYDQDFADSHPPTGHALSSHDLPAARTVVDAGFAAASVDPYAELSIEVADGAMINTDPRVALNATTAAWLLNLLRLALTTAPRIDPSDDVVGVTFPPNGTTRGTRAAVLHRLLWLGRIEHDEDAGHDLAGRLRQELDLWIDEAARLAVDRRAGTIDALASAHSVRDLISRIDDAAHRANLRGGDADLASLLGSIIAGTRRWDGDR